MLENPGKSRRRAWMTVYEVGDAFSSSPTACSVGEGGGAELHSR